MQVEVGGGGSLVTAVAGARSAVEGLLVVPVLTTSPAERVAALRQVEAISRAAQAVKLRLVRSLDGASIGPEGLAGLGATTLPGLLEATLGTGPGQARADVAAARATDPDAALDPVAGQDRGSLPGMGAALGRGEISRAHLDVAVRTMDQVPARLRRAAAPVVQEFFLGVSTRHPPRACENLAAQLLDRLDPTRCERGYDPEAHLRRRLDVVTDSTGMVILRGQLDPLTGATVTAALQHHCAPDPATRDEHDQVIAWDTRTPSQRRADALGQIAAAAMTRAGTRAGEPPRVVVHTTPDQLAALAATAPGERGAAGRAHCEQTGPLHPATLERIVCDPVIHRVLTAPTGAVLDLGRSTRLATAAQRRALAARDLGCVAPGCTRPPTWCDAHHVLAWNHGGTTDLDNLALLCPAHHNAVHAGTLAVRIHHGTAWAQVNAHLPTAATAPWATNTHHHHTRTAHQAADQIHLTLDPPHEPPEPHRRT